MLNLLRQKEAKGLKVVAAYPDGQYTNTHSDLASLQLNTFYFIA